ncbi:MAG TPA: hypothetical protein ENJ09_11950, partial [Planctomycetes bacterium]|nr:hypothetical protein [Planctomycetota bacterium]
MRFAHFQFDPREDKLGEGPSSEVFRAVDTKLGRTVALKLLRPHVEFDPNARERFEREAKHTSDLAHPNIATVFEYGEDRGTSFIAMEYLEGRPLDRILREHRLEYSEGMAIALQVADALSLVHERGFVHRDLKPANLMVLPDGQVKLLDFGICRSSADKSITQEGLLIGTVLYMSPEQVLGEEVDTRSDVFALGAVFYHAFTGELPFPGKSFPEVCLTILEASPRRPTEIREDFPAPLEAFLLKCLSREKSERYARGADALAALQAVSETLRLTSGPERPVAISGRMLVPPFQTDKAHAGFAGGLRNDLKTALERSTHLDVELLDEEPGPGERSGAFLLRATLDLDGQRGRIHYHLDRAHGPDLTETSLLLEEEIEHEDPNEWSLQSKLTGSLVRAIKRRISRYAVAPPAEARLHPGRAERIALEAHEILHRATSRHLISAMAKLRAALKEDESCVLAHAFLAEANVRKFLYWDGDVSFLQEAREEARRALALDAFSAHAHTALGFADLVSGNVGEAQRELRLAIQIDHDEWLAHRLLGGLFTRLENDEAAAPILHRAIALRPTHIGSYDHFYRVLCRLDRYEEAIETGERALALARKHLGEVPDDQEARLHAALLQGRMGLLDEARATVREARRRAPKDPYTLFHAALVHALVDDPEEALALLKEAQERGFHIESEAA